MKNISVWLRLIRIRLLSASLVAVTTGLAISWSVFHALNIPYALLTYAGVLCLHASVDILNDYFDFKNKIDIMTKGTPFSGGTRVLPEGLVEPSSVYRAGLVFLATGALIGIYFTLERGLIIGAILLFAVLSTYFYSTSVVSRGLAEIFLVIKGTLIVLGSFYVQSQVLQLVPAYSGMILGILSSAVVFVNEFPDHDADKAGGRKNIVIVMGIQNAAKFYAFYPVLVVSLGVVGVIFRLIPWFAMVGMAISIPLFARAFFTLKRNENSHDVNGFVPAMADNVLGARILGIWIALSFILVGLGA